MILFVCLWWLKMNKCNLSHLRYSYQVIELEHKLKPFIPDFIPSVGDTDAFIKVSKAAEREKLPEWFDNNKCISNVKLISETFNVVSAPVKPQSNLCDKTLQLRG